MLMSACGVQNQADTTAKPGSSYADSTCAMCVSRNCGLEISRCTEDVGCASFLLCLGSCPLNGSGDANLACEQACQEQVPATSASLVLTVAQCRTKGKGALCFECGREALPGDRTQLLLNQSCGESLKTTECMRCEENRCCKSKEGCDTSPSCSALRKCSRDCEKSADQDRCIAGCNVMYRDGRVALEQHIACTVANCQRNCSVPSLCESCLISECPDPWVDAHESLQYFEMNDCVLACNNYTANTNEKCISDVCCKLDASNNCATNPEGWRLSNNLIACAQVRCRNSCSNGI